MIEPMTQREIDKLKERCRTLSAMRPITSDPRLGVWPIVNTHIPRLLAEIEFLRAMRDAYFPTEAEAQDACTNAETYLTDMQKLRAQADADRATIERMEKIVAGHDHKGIVCAYCGAGMVDDNDGNIPPADLVEKMACHIEKCDKHPMFHMAAEIATLRAIVNACGVMHTNYSLRFFNDICAVEANETMQHGLEAAQHYVEAAAEVVRENWETP